VTIHLPPSLENRILAAVHRGRYASLDDAMAEAAAMLVQRLELEQAQQPPAATANRREEFSSQEVQQRLFDAGLISEIKPPITDLTPYQNRRAVPIQGEPISVTALRERR
jgi:Arc/MetJ-type ribon-helix-helix transcriptional regulator